jgi:hypothetical protein
MVTLWAVVGFQLLLVPINSCLNTIPAFLVLLAFVLLQKVFSTFQASFVGSAFGFSKKLVVTLATYGKFPCLDAFAEIVSVSIFPVEKMPILMFSCAYSVTIFVLVLN